MDRVRILIAGSLLSIRICCAGDFSSDSIGTAGGQLLSIGVGARAISLGGAYTAISDDASGMYWNPAGLTRSHGLSFMFMHASYLSDISFDYLSFAFSKGNSAFGGSVGYMNAGSIDHTDYSGNTLGSYRPRDYYWTLSYASDLEVIGAEKGRYSAGVSAKFINSTIIEKARTFAFDAGLTVRMKIYNLPLKLGFVAQNVGPGMKYDKERDPLSTTFRLGGAFNISRNWLFSAEMSAPRGNAPYLSAGAEHLAYSSDNMSVFLRAGVNTLTISDIPGLNGVSGGMGITFSYVSFDYALVPFGELGMTHRLSMTLKFAGEQKKTSSKRTRKYGSSKSAQKVSTKHNNMYFIY